MKRWVTAHRGDRSSISDFATARGYVPLEMAPEGTRPHQFAARYAYDNILLSRRVERPLMTAPAQELRAIKGPRVKLVGERVVLRPARSEDADALAQGFVDDPTMGAMMGMEPHQQTAEWLRSTFPEDGQDGRSPRTTGSRSPIRRAAC